VVLGEGIDDMANSKFKQVWTLQKKRRTQTLFMSGASIAEVCFDMGIAQSTFRRWANTTDKEKVDFREVVSLGKEASEAWWTRQGRENLDTRGFNHGLWLINMVNRFNWRSNYNKKEEYKEIEHKGTIEVKNKVDVDAILQKAINRGIQEIDDTIH